MSPVRAGPAGRDGILAAAIEHFAAHGVGDTSLRALAADIGTSHRMLIYHFGSRDGLLGAVVDTVEAAQRELLTATLTTGRGSEAARLERFWRQVTDAALVYGPLFFELGAHAMQHQPHAAALRDSLVDPWLDAIEPLFRHAGLPRRQARVQARAGLALARGLLFDLLLSGDRAGVDAAMRAFIRSTFPR